MAASDTWRWDEESFVRAWEAGVFGDQRVELVEGEVWPVSVGPWHGAVTMNLARSLPNDEWRITAATLPAGGSLPDPDVWVHARAAKPIARLGSTGRLARWNPGDVALVAEVADSTIVADVEVKSRLYGRGSYPVYWVVHRGGVEVFTDPFEGGYRARTSVGRLGHVEVPYRPGVRLDVAVLLDAED